MNCDCTISGGDQHTPACSIWNGLATLSPTAQMLDDLRFADQAVAALDQVNRKGWCEDVAALVGPAETALKAAVKSWNNHVSFLARSKRLDSDQMQPIGRCRYADDDRATNCERYTTVDVGQYGAHEFICNSCAERLAG